MLSDLEELPLETAGGPRGLVPWDEVLDHYKTTDPDDPQWFTVSQMINYVTEDLGVVSGKNEDGSDKKISYSSAHSWLRRVNKKPHVTITKKIHGRTSYHKIIVTETAEEEAEEQDPDT